ncbi:MAG: sulfotransferase [Anaerolineales bacterium]
MPLSRLKTALHILLRGEAPQTAQRNPIPAITAEEVDEARAFFPMPKFFIYGHARSGTTLLTRLIRLHPQVHCNYQAHFFSRKPLLQALVNSPEIEGWLTRRSNRWNQGRDLSPLVLRATADFIMERDARRAGKTIVGDKSPNSLLDGEAVRLMQQVYPDARLIFIVRDGRDAAVSHRFQAFIDIERSLSAEDLRIRADFTANPQPFFDGTRAIFTEKGIRAAAEGWVKNVRETDAEGKARYGEQYIALRYEDLLTDPHAQMKRLWQFLGADVSDPALDDLLTAEMHQNPDADWQKQKAADLVSPLEKGKQGSWRNLFTLRDKQIFDAVAGETLRSWNYPATLEDA